MSFAGTKIYLACGHYDKRARDRLRYSLKKRTGRQTSSMHCRLSNPQAHVRSLRLCAALSEAGHILWVDDGVASILRSLLGRGGSTLVPDLEAIIQSASLDEILPLRHSRAIRVTTVNRLPHVDAFVTGCNGFSDDGYVYSTYCNLSTLYRALRRHRKITGRTLRIVLAEPHHLVKPDNFGFMRAHFAAFPGELRQFGWADAKPLDS